MLIVAEIGTSHEGSEEKAKKLIDTAFSSGADAVKFQWVYADEILHPKTGFVDLPGGKISLYERFKSLECSDDFFLKMKEYAHSKNLKFICSPFGLKSLEKLVKIEPDYIKIASPELNHFPLLKHLSEFRENQKRAGKEMSPVIISSGVSKLSDIEKALEILGQQNVFLLHCVTSYPALETEYNLNVISNLKNIFGIPVGVSDHSMDAVLVPSLSVASGAQIIEKHITLSRESSGLDDKVALDGEMFSLMVHCVRQSDACMKRYGLEKGKSQIISQLSSSYGKEKVLEVLGSGVKFLSDGEKDNYGRTNRSLHFMKDIPSGSKIGFDDVKVLRTEKILSPGISPEFYETVIGKILVKDAKDGEGVTFSHFFKE